MGHQISNRGVSKIMFRPQIIGRSLSNWNNWNAIWTAHWRGCSKYSKSASKCLTFSSWKGRFGERSWHEINLSLSQKYKLKRTFEMKFDFQVLLQMTVTINTATQDEIDMNPLAGFANPVREVVKKRIFYGQWKMHFWDPSQWVSKNQFQWKMDQNFHICLWSGPRRYWL